MTDTHDSSPHARARSDEEDASAHSDPSRAASAGHAPGGQAPPSEQELRAAYEAELNRITSIEMALQSAVSLLNIGGRRLGLAPSTESERDLEQVRDAIDGVRALMPVLERRMPAELGPLRDALAQLQMAYAREAGGAAPAQTGQGAASGGGGKADEAAKSRSEKPEDTSPGEKGPGPAEASGRLWVPGR